MNLIKCGLPLLIVVAIASCKEKEVVKNEVLRPVRYQVIGASKIQNIRTFSGVAKAEDEIELSFRNSGIITQINVTKGQRVRKGMLIAKLDNIEAILDYEKSISAVNSAESAMNTAKNELDRVKILYEKRTVSLSDYEQAKNNYQNALAQFESAKRNQRIQETKTTYGYIYAPADGIIAETNGKVNERISAGAIFAVLISGNRMNIEVGLPENVINDVEVGMETAIVFPSLEGENFVGTVKEVSPIIVENAATYPVEIEIQNPDPRIKAGMAASITFDFTAPQSEVDGYLTVPLKAVGEDGQGNFVFVIETTDGDTAQVRKQHIEIGDLTPSGFKIIDGLEPGQRVATAGLQTLLDGQKVRLQ